MAFSGLLDTLYKQPAFCGAELRARSDVPSPIQKSGIAVVRISQFAMMPDYGIVVIRANTAERRNCPDQHDNKKQEIA
jgi:hypothetical protein